MHAEALLLSCLVFEYEKNMSLQLKGTVLLSSYVPSLPKEVVWQHKKEEKRQPNSQEKRAKRFLWARCGVS